MIEGISKDDLQLLQGALRQEGFRFIIVGHNRRSIYDQFKQWIEDQYRNRSITELTFSHKSYREISDGFKAISQGIVLIPDFDWLYRQGNESICTAFNQRRDFLAKKANSIVCFVQPSNLLQTPKRLPDWWSLKSLDMEIGVDVKEEVESSLETINESSPIYGLSLQEREEEIARLEHQLGLAEENPKEKVYLLERLGELQFSLGKYEEAHQNFQKGLESSQRIKNRSGEGKALDNISQIYDAKGDYDTALSYLEQSLSISQEIGDRSTEGTTLNNISQIYDTKGDYDTALSYLEQSLSIRKEIGDRSGEGTTLNNLATTAHAKGDYDTALSYLERSLSIRKEIGDRSGEGTTLNNISQIYDAKGDYDTALSYLEQSLSISQEIGDRSTEGTTLNNISQIYDAKGDYDTALSYLEQSLSISQEIGDRSTEGTTLNNISQIYYAKGDYDTALSYLEQDLKITSEIGNIPGLPPTLINMGAIIFQQKNNPEEALPLFLQAYSILERLNSPGIDNCTAWINAIIQQIGEARFQEIISQLPKNPDEI